jgi:hypothetical protein
MYGRILRLAFSLSSYSSLCIYAAICCSFSGPKFSYFLFFPLTSSEIKIITSTTIIIVEARIMFFQGIRYIIIVPIHNKNMYTLFIMPMIKLRAFRYELYLSIRKMTSKANETVRKFTIPSQVSAVYSILDASYPCLSPIKCLPLRPFSYISHVP